MENNEISLKQLFHALMRHLALLIAVTVVFGAGAWAVSNFLITPKYTASSKMIAISNTERTGTVYTTSEHNAAVALVLTTAEIMKTERILEPASERLAAEGYNYSTKQLKSMLSITSLNDTEVFSVTVTGTKQADLAKIVNTITAVAEEKIGEIMKAGTTSVLEPSMGAVKTSPNAVRNAILGALVGFVLCALVVILHDLNDTTIWTEDDITALCDIPVLGLIPQLSSSDATSKTKE